MLKIFRWLYEYIKPYKAWFILNVISLFISTGLTIAMAALIQKLVQDAVDGKSQDTIFPQIGMLSGLVLIGIGVSYFSIYSNGKYGNGAVKNLKEQVATHIRDITMIELDHMHSGDLASRINNDIGQIQSFIKNNITKIIYLPVMGICAAAYMLILNPLLFFACFILTPVTLFLANKFRQRVNGLSTEIQDYLGKGNSVIQDIIGGIAIVKAFQIEKAVYDKCCLHLDQSLTKGFAADKYASLSIMYFIVMYELPNILCLVFGGILAYRGELTIGGLVVFLQLIWYVIEPAAAFSHLLLAISTTHGAIERIREIFAKPLERTGGHAFPVSATGSIIDIKNADFFYGSGKPVLKDFSFSLAKGGTYALVGASGSGKSTVLKLLNGFYEIDDGEILLYEQKYAHWNLVRLRENFAVVAQDVYLFPGSIGENIAYGKPGATGEEIVAAAKAAGADKFIRAFPDGYRTPVGERGNSLSGGQKQRIAIARAVIKDAPILLLDEPTSALDNTSEKLIQEALDEIMRHKTTLVAAHRLSTIMKAQKIFVIDKGRIAEAGTHAELLAAQGAYFSLYERQFLNEAE